MISYIILLHFPPPPISLLYIKNIHILYTDNFNNSYIITFLYNYTLVILMYLQIKLIHWSKKPRINDHEEFINKKIEYDNECSE